MAITARNCLPILTILFIAFAYASSSYAAGHTCSSRDSNIQCMVCNCFFEAAGENSSGKMAVNVVVIARANNADKPGAYCKIVYAPWQFSWTRNKSTVEMNTPAYRDCQASVNTALTYFSKSTNPTHYYANKGKEAIPAPKWAKVPPLTKGPQVGNHIFYNDPTQTIIKSPAWLNNMGTTLRSWFPSVVATPGARR